MKLLPLTKGFFAKVDDADWERVIQYRWCVSEAKRLCYAITYLPGEKGRRTYLHRFLLCPPLGIVVDHIDGDGLNCARANLRLASVSSNAAWGKQRRRKSKYRGVIWSKNRWQARGQHAGKSFYLGRFIEEERAALVWDAWALASHGEFARLNFPEKLRLKLENENTELYARLARAEERVVELEGTIDDLRAKLDRIPYSY